MPRPSVRPWWSRLDGVPPSLERRTKQQWPDWDQITDDERGRRVRYRTRVWLGAHPVIVSVVVVLSAIAVIDALTRLFAHDRSPGILAWSLAFVLSSVFSTGWLVREAARGRRGV